MTSLELGVCIFYLEIKVVICASLCYGLCVTKRICRAQVVVVVVVVVVVFYLFSMHT